MAKYTKTVEEPLIDFEATLGSIIRAHLDDDEEFDRVWRIVTAGHAHGTWGEHYRDAWGAVLTYEQDLRSEYEDTIETVQKEKEEAEKDRDALLQRCRDLESQVEDLVAEVERRTLPMTQYGADYPG